MIKEVDPRYNKIQKALQESLMQLIDEKPFDKITVNDIANRAEINRSTFYSHYPDILALLNDCLMAGVTLKDQDIAENDIIEHPEKLFTRTQRYLYFCFTHPDLYLMVLREFQTNPYFSDFNEAVVNEICQQQKALLTSKPRKVIPERQIACYVLAGQANLLRCWIINRPPLSIEELSVKYNIVEARVMCSLLGIEVPEWVKSYENKEN